MFVPLFWIKKETKCASVHRCQNLSIWNWFKHSNWFKMQFEIFQNIRIEVSDRFMWPQHNNNINDKEIVIRLSHTSSFHYTAMKTISQGAAVPSVAHVYMHKKYACMCKAIDTWNFRSCDPDGSKSWDNVRFIARQILNFSKFWEKKSVLIPKFDHFSTPVIPSKSNFAFKN